ncbi:protein ParA-like [Hippocampus zosterae]|uniref:protein ParA-like n=1 Tax=Hippocampus zosterae TaxID=109293 RepID=UPI00223E0036|nr:protein ParA-like [Hippocampus zosterae]
MSPKGGCGKSTTVMVLASALSTNEDLSIAVVDADPRQSLARVWIGKREESEIGEPPFTVTSEIKETEIVDMLEKVEESADVVIVDLEGAAGLMSSYVATSADLCIVPMRPSALDGDAAGSALKLIRSTGKAMKREIPTVVLITQTDAAITTRSHREVVEELDSAGIRRCSVELMKRAPFERMMAEGKTLFELADTESVAKARENAKAMAREIVAIVEANH